MSQGNHVWQDIGRPKVNSSSKTFWKLIHQRVYACTVCGRKVRMRYGQHGWKPVNSKVYKSECPNWLNSEIHREK